MGEVMLVILMALNAIALDEYRQSFGEMQNSIEQTNKVVVPIAELAIKNEETINLVKERIFMVEDRIYKLEQKE